MNSPSPYGLALPPLPAPADTWALFLDLDGTLAPLAAHPGLVCVEPALVSLLGRLSQGLGGAVCILSGRPMVQLERLLEGASGLFLVGSHGAESPMVEMPTSAPDSLRRLRTEVERDVASLDHVWVEQKPHGFAVHFRGHRAAADQIRRAIARHLSITTGFRALEGNCVVEVLTEGCDKGSALASLTVSPAFRNRKPVVLGDDITDEDAFAAAEKFNGFGVRVGVRQPTSARYGLPCVTLAHTWLVAVADRVAPV